MCIVIVIITLISQSKFCKICWETDAGPYVYYEVVTKH